MNNISFNSLNSTVFPETRKRKASSAASPNEENSSQRIKVANEAIKRFEKEAESGNIKAIYKVIASGILGRDPKKYRRLCEIGAEKNDIQLIFLYATSLVQEVDGPVDLKKAYSLFHRNALKGHTPSITLLGACYLFGHGTNPDITKALEFLMIAADRGDEKAQENVERCFLNGQGLEVYPEKAFAFLKEKENESNPKVLFQLGRCYRHGFGTEPDSLQALFYFDAAKELGYQPSENEIKEFNCGAVSKSAEASEEE